MDFTDRPIPSFTDMKIFGPLGGPETELNRVEADLFQHSLLNRVLINYYYWLVDDKEAQGTDYFSLEVFVSCIP